jgi:sterol desaturase/sphingolipid hydroxylase (fatty acid hydroxylase superfamily)
MIFAETLLVLLAALAINGTLTYLLVCTRVFDSLKIQRAPYRKAEIARRLPLIARTFFTTSLGAAIAFSLGAGSFITTSRPTLLRVVSDVFIIFVFHDTWVYFLHRALHRNRRWFRKIHSVHHRARQPVPLDFLYLHPTEGALGAIGMIVAIALLAPIPIHSLWAYLFCIHLHEGHLHWGLRSVFPFRFPLLATIAHHDLHHAKPQLGTNFAPISSVWDRAFRTETRP